MGYASPMEIALERHGRGEGRTLPQTQGVCGISRRDEKESSGEMNSQVTTSHNNRINHQAKLYHDN